MTQLSGLDSLFLYAESPAMHMHVVLVAILDPTDVAEPLDIHRLRKLVGERVHLVPPFTRKLAPVPFGITHPSWVDVDPALVDLDRHVRSATLPQPGGPEDLGALCGQIASIPLDRDHPLWEMWLLDGLYDGNLALVTKIHHSCIDGVSGAELITVFFDLDAAATVPIVPGDAAEIVMTADAPPPRSSEPEPAAAEIEAPTTLAPGDSPDGDATASTVAETVHESVADETVAQTEASSGETATSGTAATKPSEIEILADALRQRAETLRTLPPLLQRAVGGVLDIRKRRAQRAEIGGTPLRAPRVGMNGRLTPERNCAFAHLPLSEALEVKTAAKCTLNDLVLAVCAGALRQYLIGRNELPEGPLTASCPVSVRAKADGSGEAGGTGSNAVSILLTRLHTEIEDPAERLHTIRRATNAGKAEHLIMGPSMLAEMAEAVDPTVIRLLAQAYLRSGLTDRHAPLHNVVVSNVPGPPIPVYLAGAQLVRAYPMGPITEGAGMNITVMSYLDSIDIGFMVCPDLVPDVWDLAELMGPAFAELREVFLPEGASAETGSVSATI